jgi:hypothetical protein
VSGVSGRQGLGTARWGKLEGRAIGRELLNVLIACIGHIDVAGAVHRYANWQIKLAVASAGGDDGCHECWKACVCGHRRARSRRVSWPRMDRARPSGTGEPWLGRPAGWRCVPRVEPTLTSRVYTGGR